MKTLLRALTLPLIVFIWSASCAFTILPRTDYQLRVFAGDRSYTFCYPEIDLFSGKLYLKDVDAVVERIYLDTAVPPRDAEITFTPNTPRPFTIAEEKSGRAVSKRELKSQILRALNTGQGEVHAKTFTIKAGVSAKELALQTKLRAEFSTRYESSAATRKHNVKLACCAINGTFLKNGEQFSFNKAVGERTHERGYKDAKIILNGSFTEGVGGGVCQVSTTLYNCAILAGMDIDERHPHSLAVSYVEPSFDAMVSSCSDLRFTNSSGGNVYIEACADGENMTFRIYGLAPPFAVKRHYEVISVEDSGYDEVVDWTGELCGDNESRIVTPSIPTVKSRATVTFIQNGSKRTYTLSTDTYRGRRGTIARKPP